MGSFKVGEVVELHNVNWVKMNLTKTYDGSRRSSFCSKNKNNKSNLDNLYLDDILLDYSYNIDDFLGKRYIIRDRIANHCFKISNKYGENFSIPGFLIKKRVRDDSFENIAVNYSKNHNCISFPSILHNYPVSATSFPNFATDYAQINLNTFSQYWTTNNATTLTYREMERYINEATVVTPISTNGTDELSGNLICR